MKALSFLAGFFLLFALYHLAEAQILFHNSPTGFLAFAFLFLAGAHILARVQGFAGLSTWCGGGLKSFARWMVPGMLVGFGLHLTLYMAAQKAGLERLSFVPGATAFLTDGALLVFGCFFSSFTEDLLTRCYLWKHLGGRVSDRWIVLVCSVVYTLNHIHRLDEPVYLFYVFLLGLHFALPLVRLRNLGYTVGLHWAGNIVYQLTSNVMHTESRGGSASLWLSICGLTLFLPLHYWWLHSRQASAKQLAML